MGWNFLVTAQLLFGTVFPHLYTLLTVSLVLGLGLRLTCSQDICSRPTDALTGSFTRYKFVTLLTYLIIHTHNLYTPTIVAELLNLAWWRTTPRQRTLVVDPALHSRVWSTQEPKFFKHIPHTHTHTHTKLLKIELQNLTCWLIRSRQISSHHKPTLSPRGGVCGTSRGPGVG